MTNLEINKIGAGYDVPENELVNIASIVPSGDVAFASPKSLALFNDGLIKSRLTMLLFTAGYQNSKWIFGFMTYAQHSYLRSTYCNGGLSGEVTVYSLFGSTSYARKNAILTLPTPEQLESEYWYKKVPVKLIKLGAAA